MNNSREHISSKLDSNAKNYSRSKSTKRSFEINDEFDMSKNIQKSKTYNNYQKKSNESSLLYYQKSDGIRRAKTSLNKMNIDLESMFEDGSSLYNIKMNKQTILIFAKCLFACIFLSISYIYCNYSKLIFKFLIFLFLLSSILYIGYYDFLSYWKLLKNFLVPIGLFIFKTFCYIFFKKETTTVDQVFIKKEDSNKYRFQDSFDKNTNFNEYLKNQNLNKIFEKNSTQAVNISDQLNNTNGSTIDVIFLSKKSNYDLLYQNQTEVIINKNKSIDFNQSNVFDSNHSATKTIQIDEFYKFENNNAENRNICFLMKIILTWNYLSIFYIIL